MEKQKIVLLGTGGTIAGTVNQASGQAHAEYLPYTAAQLSVAQLLQTVPGLNAVLGDCELVLEQVAQVDSKDMDLDIWRSLALRCAYWLAQSDVRGITITHGTDTLEESAYFLQTLLQPVKPVVMTCAMRPADAPEPDGPQNLRDALSVLQDAGARGVMLVCAGSVHEARHVQKAHPSRLDAFASGDAGPLALIRDGRVRWLRPCLAFATDPDYELAPWRTAQQWPRVEIVMNYVGAGGAIVDALVQQGVAGLVAAGTGNGTLHHDLEAALLRAQAQGVRVVRASRCAEGQIVPRAGDLIPDSGGLSPVKARVALLLELISSKYSASVIPPVPQRPEP